MRSRTEIHDAFVSRFHSGDRNEPATDQQLDAIDTALSTKLPTAYRQFMAKHGVVFTPTILDGVSDLEIAAGQELDYCDIQEFLDPQKVIEDTKLYWSGGMPEDVIGFASDCMGNMIGFHRQLDYTDDAPVVFFDHDFVEVSEMAPSFDSFLMWYLDNL